MARPYKDPQPLKTGRSRLAQWWRELRTGAGLDQHAVAAELGCSATHISNIEHGRRMPSFALLTRFEELVGSEGILRSIWAWAMEERAAETAGARTVTKGRTIHGDRVQFVRDIAPRGEPVFEPLQRFTAGWEIRNAGPIAWKNRYLQQVGPLAPLYAPVSREERTTVPSTEPGETVEVKVPMMAPQLPGESITYFHMVNADGSLCFPDRYADGVWVRIRVREPTRLKD
jgi:transcriptional regulator with XRE-family HTH domain